MKRLLTVILFTLILVIPITPCEATHHYLWSNKDYAFWMDDSSIVTNNNKTWAVFDIIFEDLRTKEQLKYSDPTIIFVTRGRWMVATLGVNPQPVEYFNDWWQSWALKWLLKHNYLCDNDV